MAKLSGTVSPVYPLAALLVGLASLLHQSRPWLFYGLIVALAALAGLRLYLFFGFDRLFDRQPGLWKTLFAGSLLLNGALWGVTLVWAVIENGFVGSTIFGLLFSTVMTSLSLNTLTPSLGLTRGFVAVVLVPTTIGFAITGGTIERLAAIFLMPYGLQLWILSRRLYSDYWNRAIQIEVAKLRSEEHERERDRLQAIRRELEVEVERRVADYRRIFEGAHDAIIIFEPENEIILEANQRACDLYGFSRSELVGMSLLDISENRERRHPHVERTLNHGTTYHFETTQFRKDGRKLIFEISASAIEYQGQVAILSINRDVTVRKQAQLELQRHRRELEDLIAERTADLKQAMVTLEGQNAELEAKAAELERFTYTISHDLKSPLITIRGFLGMIEADLARGHVDRARQDMGRIHEAASQMARLLDELLELSRIGRVINPPRPVRMSELAREVVQVLDGSIRERGVDVEVAEDMPIVHGDRVRLFEVYQNLIENAIKFMGDQESPRLEVGVRDDDEGLAFFVRDNGIGISSKYHDKVFGLFERLDKELVDGTGVGLALVKRIVEVHHGRIWVESTGLGKGSTFLFTLPYVRLEPQPDLQASAGLQR